jgi:uncharacterized protein Yka (UPF0111/DUF47 family)
MRRWFLPHPPDLLAVLVRQGNVATSCMDALVRWCEGNHGTLRDLRGFEDESEQVRKDLLALVKQAFVTAVYPEDAYELSERLDSVIVRSAQLVQKAHALELLPEPAMAEMATKLRTGVNFLVKACGSLVNTPDAATAYADDAVARVREVSTSAALAISSTIKMTDLRIMVGQQEIYRHFLAIGESITSVAHRIWYAVVKQQ